MLKVITILPYSELQYVSCGCSGMQLHDSATSLIIITPRIASNPINTNRFISILFILMVHSEMRGGKIV